MKFNLNCIQMKTLRSFLIKQSNACRAISITNVALVTNLRQTKYILLRTCGHVNIFYAVSFIYLYLFVDQIGSWPVPASNYLIVLANIYYLSPLAQVISFERFTWGPQAIMFINIEIRRNVRLSAAQYGPLQLLLHHFKLSLLTVRDNTTTCVISRPALYRHTLHQEDSTLILHNVHCSAGDGAEFY